jgi:HlyD family secretion protein
MQLHRFKLFTLLAILASTLVLVLGIFFWRGPQVPSVTPFRGSVIQKVVAVGQIVPKARIHITSQIAGRVAKVSAQEGDKIPANAPLSNLENAEALALVEEARAAYEQAQAKADQIQGVSARLAHEALHQVRERLAKAKATAKREQELDQAHATTKESLDQALSDVRLAESQVQAALTQAKASAPKGSDSRIALAAVEQTRAALAAAESKLSLYTIRAPIAAQVIQRHVEPGDGVPVGGLLFVLGSLEPLRVKIQVDEKYISLIQEGQRAKVTADAYPGRPINATVERLSPAVSSDRGALEVQLMIEDAPPYLRFDMSASVEIVTNSAQDVLLLPTQAVQDAGTEHPYVYIFNNGRVARRDIALGLKGDQNIEITSGLLPQDLVLLPQEALKIGDRVRPIQKG